MPSVNPRPSDADDPDRDPELRGRLAKEGRLWLMAAVCAAIGATTVALTDRVLPGVLAFVVALAVFVPIWRWYEARRR